VALERTTKYPFLTRLRTLDPAHWIALAAALVFLPLLGATELAGPWEQLHAAVMQRMAEDGPASAFTPVRHDETYLDRPAPAYWLGAAAIKLFGAGSFAARLPAALAGILLVWGVFMVVRRLRGSATAALAAGVTATVPLAILLFRSALPEALAVAASSGSFLALAARATDPAAPRRYEAAGWILLGLAFGLGGAPAALPPIAALVPFALLRGRRPAWGALRPFRGALVALAVAAPLAIPPFVLHGAAAWRGVLRPDVAEESAVDDEKLEGDARPDDRMGFDVDLESLAWGAFPWSALAPAALLGLALRRRKPDVLPASMAAGPATAVDDTEERGRDFDFACVLWLLAAFGTTALLGDRWHHDPFGALVPLGVVVGLYLGRKVAGEWSPVDAVLAVAGAGLLLVLTRDLGGGGRLAQAFSSYAPGNQVGLLALAWPLRVAAFGTGAAILAALLMGRWRGWTAGVAVGTALIWTLAVVHALVPAIT
jgi:4-amino-4-deoxy-L-arabinose transferase-like glycosyltransferase